MTTIEAASHAPAILGECPVWSGHQQVLYWADIDGRAIHRLDPTTGATASRALAGRPGSFVLATDPNRLLVACEHELVVLDWEAGAVTSWLHIEEAGTGNRLNDGRCDPMGRYVVGSMYADTNAGRSTGSLYRIESSGELTGLRTGIGVTNGLAFDADRQRMYFADTPTDRVLVFDYDLDAGHISNERVFLDYTDLPGKPDGGCVDADGCYWSASVYGWAVIRITPEGAVDRRIELPVQKPSMPAFGGSDLSTLFVTTIGMGGTTPSEPGRDGFEPGDLLALDVGVHGLPEPVFDLAANATSKGAGFR
ncbi:MAG: SMP-30/gluconolactonase/LRE family protein [bacterium]|nr:SMP-30/gluconolactonase/LRE family protein [bacterium]